MIGLFLADFGFLCLPGLGKPINPCFLYKPNGSPHPWRRFARLDAVVDGQQQSGFVSLGPALRGGSVAWRRCVFPNCFPSGVGVVMRPCPG